MIKACHTRWPATTKSPPWGCWWGQQVETAGLWFPSYVPSVRKQGTINPGGVKERWSTAGVGEGFSFLF